MCLLQYVSLLLTYLDTEMSNVLLMEILQGLQNLLHTSSRRALSEIVIVHEMFQNVMSIYSTKIEGK